MSEVVTHQCSNCGKPYDVEKIVLPADQSQSLCPECNIMNAGTVKLHLQDGHAEVISPNIARDMLSEITDINNKRTEQKKKEAENSQPLFTSRPLNPKAPDRSVVQNRQITNKNYHQKNNAIASSPKTYKDGLVTSVFDKFFDGISFLHAIWNYILHNSYSILILLALLFATARFFIVGAQMAIEYNEIASALSSLKKYPEIYSQGETAIRERLNRQFMISSITALNVDDVKIRDDFDQIEVSVDFYMQKLAYFNMGLSIHIKKEVILPRVAEETVSPVSPRGQLSRWQLREF